MRIGWLGFLFNASLGRILVAVAAAWLVYAQVSDTPLLEFRKSETLKRDLPPAQPRPPCTELGEGRLPEDAAIQRTDGTIRLLKGANLSLALERDAHFRQLQWQSREEDIAMCFMQAFGKFFKLSAPREELQPVMTDPDTAGFTHVQLRQLYAGLPVRDGEIVVHLNPEKQVYRVDGRYHPTPSGITITPRINAQRATEIARAALASDRAAQRGYRTQQAFYVDRQNRLLLAYQVIAYQGITDDWDIWIDANTGDILEKNALAKPRS